jgi:hypothetical protein
MEIRSVRFLQYRRGDTEYDAIAAAPVLFARKNTIGTFSDVPLLLYCERLHEGGGDVLQYTAIFSNEDGGTSTRALMARWGRSTDIEYIYRVYLGPDGQPKRRTVQGPDHRELPYEGAFEGAHPLLMPVTQNNMVAPTHPDQPFRFQLAPEIVDLTEKPRESVMDAHPVTYEVMAKELVRENKLRPFGSVAGEKISDPANYLYVAYQGTFAGSGLAVVVSLRDGRGFSSDLGRPDLLIGRSGAVQTAVELPPGSTVADIAGITFSCSVMPRTRNEPLPHSGECAVRWAEAGFKVRGGRQPEWRWKHEQPVRMIAGQSVTLRP